jgi:hypothetical protein
MISDFTVIDCLPLLNCVLMQIKLLIRPRLQFWSTNKIKEEMVANAASMDLRDVVLSVVRLSNTGVVVNCQTKQFLTLHGLSGTNNFGCFQPHRAKDLVKSMNWRHPASSLGIIMQNNLTGIIWYMKDQRWRGLVLDLNNVDKDVLLDGHLAYKAYVQNCDKGKNIKSLEKWTNKVDFHNWDQKVTKTLSLVHDLN